MSRSKSKPRCMYCRHDPPKPAKDKERFCSMNCAASYARELVNVDNEGWCNTCNEWKSTNPIDSNICDTCESELIKPEDND